MSPTLPCQLHQYHNEKNFILFYFLGTRWRNVRGKEYNSNQTRQEQRLRSSKKKNVGKSQGQAEHPKTQQNHGPCLFSVSSFFKRDYVVAADQMPSH